MKGHFVKAQSEEVLIAVLVGALVGVAVTSLLSAGADGYLPSTAYGFTSWARMLLFYVGLLGGGALGGWYGVTQERDTHLKGSLYIDHIGRATKAMRALEYAQMSDAQRRHLVPGLQVGGIEFSRRTESTHVIVIGLTGTGKTTLLDSVERQIMARGDRMIVHDIKGDFTKYHYNPKTCVMLGPWDTRGVLWDATRDIATPAQADAFAARVFDIKNVDPKNRHWYQSAAALLSGAIRSYMAERKPWRWSDIADVWENDHVGLVLRAAQGNSIVRQNFPNFFAAIAAGKPPRINDEEDSIFSTVADDFGWILNYAALDRADADGKRFSVADWVFGTAHKEIKTVILNYSTNDDAVCQQVFGALLATVATTLGSSRVPEVGADEPGNLWLILDEFAQLGSRAFKAIQSISELGRSKGARLVLATQSVDQITALLGAEKAAPVLHQQRTRIYLQCNPEAAEKISTDVGLHEIQRIQTTAEAGAVAGKTKSVTREKALMPGEITGLRVLPHGDRGEAPGVEMILHEGSTLGKILQPFGPEQKQVAEQFIENPLWQKGTLKYVDEVAATPKKATVLAPRADSTPVLETAPVSASEETGWAGDYSSGGEDEDDSDTPDAAVPADTDSAGEPSATEPPADHDDPVAPATQADPDDIPLE